MQPEASQNSKHNRYRFGLGVIILLFGLPLLLYYGYCWGWWGRQSLLLQYFFQCSCPPSSAETRYPQQVDVIVSACSQPFARISPSGRLLYVREEKSAITTAYLLDLQTLERIKVTNEPFSSFITDDLWFVEIGLEDYLMDRITGERYPIQKFVFSHPDGQVNGEANLPLLAECLRQAEQVFLIGASTDTVVALAADFRTYPEQNFIFDRFDLSDFNTEQFLQENHISYQTVLPDFPQEVISPDGRLIARPDGIYIVTTGKKIVEGFSASRFFRAYSRKYFMPRGWLYDGSGVIYSKFLNPCLIESRLLWSDDPDCSYEVSQPVILLKIPSEYLVPTEER